ncbi:recombinase family protein [Clostridium bowmanii]|uniref:recombinase family protein n=1 Tax=Clostridium bowmanii TaxID=132925 RepID=UPI001C0C4655|nr:recombinase family protein [Clostridium bowmanii]MBU3189333.1 recombinase family protein [Clostridium bowmanii]MCA1073949.1 recombinase family protein [Clostridium bowmanii]
MNQVAIYCRLSDEDKNKITTLSDSESIQNQKNLLMKYAIDIGWDIFKIYSDDNYSGLDKDRPEFKQMIQDAENKKFDIILCKHQSRFTRDMELVEKYLHNKFIEWGIRFVTVVDGVDTSDKHNKKSRQINGLVNEWYCEDISESIKYIFKLKQQQGKFIGSFATYGYEKDPKDKNKLIIDDVAAETVRKIFTWYIDGYGTQKISQMLNGLGTPNPTKYKKLQGYNYINTSSKDDLGLWNKTTTKRMLKNQMYIGNMVQHVHEKLNYKSDKKIALKYEDWIIVENTHLPIIDKKTFDIVQERLKSNTRSSGEGQAHIFAGKVRCMDCGNTMVRNSGVSGYKYLRCKLHYINPKKKLCTSHSIRLENLEQIVTERLKSHLINLNEESLSSKLFESSSDKGKLKSLQKQLNNTEKDIIDRDLVLKTLYIDKVKGIITVQQFNEFNLSFFNEKNDLINRRDISKNTIEAIEVSLNDISKYKELVKKYKNFTELNSLMVNELIDYIEIVEKDIKTKEQRVKIYWLF